MPKVYNRRSTVYQDRLVSTMKTYKDPITLSDLSDLLSWPMSRTYSVFGSLRKTGRLEVDKTKDPADKKIKYQFVHFGMKTAKLNTPVTANTAFFPVDQDDSYEGTSILDAMLDEPGIKDNTAVSKKTGHERCSVERGYHFLMAGISKSSGEFADFFGISEEQAMRLLATIAARYPSEIKVTMRACLQIDARKPQF